MRRVRPFMTLTVLAVVAAGCTTPPPDPQPSPSGPTAEVVAADYARLALSTPKETSPLLQKKHPLTPADASLIGPEYATAFDWTAAVPRIDAEDALRMGLPGAIAAPSGAELFLAHVAWPLPRPVGKAGVLSPDAQVVVGGQARSSSVQFGRDSILILAVAPGAPILLKMSDKGRTQTLDLRSGERGSDAKCEVTFTSPPEPLDIAVPVGFRTGTLRLDPKVICHGCHPGTPSSVRVTLVAGPVPMAP